MWYGQNYIKVNRNYFEYLKAVNVQNILFYYSKNLKNQKAK